MGFIDKQAGFVYNEADNSEKKKELGKTMINIQNVASEQTSEQAGNKGKCTNELNRIDGWRGYKERFFYALFPCGLLCFIYLFFGPLFLIHNNATAFHINILQATPWYLCVFVPGTVLFAAMVALFKGQLFQGWIRVVLWLSVASYIQCYILNPDFGLLNGKPVEWPELADVSLINLGVWGLMFFILSFAEVKLNKYWKKIVCGMCLLLVLMQTTALATFYFDNARNNLTETDKTSFYLSAEGTMEISSKENVIIFILDGTSNNSLDQTLAVYPDTLAAFHDFTYYRNCAPTYYGTFPEVMSILTGNVQYDTNRSYKDFIHESWQSDKANTFYGILKNADYHTYSYTDNRKLTENYSDVEGKINNAVKYEAQWRIQPIKMYKQIAKLTCWVYFPTGLKASFFLEPKDFTQIVSGYPADAVLWQFNGSMLANGLRGEGLATGDHNVLALYHLYGAHWPHRMNEAGIIGKETTSPTQQVKGNLLLIEEYMQQMKDLGVYDTSTIIVTADHGDYQYTGSKRSNSAILFVKLRGEQHAALQISDAPVTHMELMPTIAEEIAPDNTYDFGQTLAEIGEDEVRERTLYRWVKLDADKSGAYDSFYVFHFTCDINDLNDLSSPDEVLPLYDSHY